MPDLRAHVQLSTADVLDLRVSIRSRVPDIGASSSIVPCVRYNSTLDGYELHEGGNVLCWSASLEVVAALLRGERFEPGFIRKVLNPAQAPDELHLNADEREALSRARADIEAQRRARVRFLEDEARERRLRAGAPSEADPDLSLDDLLTPSFLDPPK